MPNFAFISARNLSWLGDALTVNFMPSTYAPNRYDTTLTATPLFTTDLVNKSVTATADPFEFNLLGQIGAVKSESGTIGSVVITRGTAPILYCDIDPNFVANGSFVLTEWLNKLFGVQAQVAPNQLGAYYIGLVRAVLIALYETEADTYTTYTAPEGIPAEVYVPCSIVTTDSVAGFASPIAVYALPETVNAELYVPCSIVETDSLTGFGFPTVNPVFAPTISFDIRPGTIGRPEIVITSDTGTGIVVDLLQAIPEGYTVDLYRAVDFARGRFELLEANVTFPTDPAIPVSENLSYKFQAVYRVSNLKGANSSIVYRTVNPL